jgi:hypothetical protein
VSANTPNTTACGDDVNENSCSAFEDAQSESKGVKYDEESNASTDSSKNDAAKSSDNGQARGTKLESKEGDNTTTEPIIPESGSILPRITGSMVPVVHEDVVTRIKNIQNIYLGYYLAIFLIVFF